MYEVKKEILDSFCLAQNPLAAERDYIECNILNQIFQFPYFCNNFVFTGGGTISKIYHMGNRINQDLDLACFDFKEVLPTRSVGQLGKFKSRFRDYIFTELKEKIETGLSEFGKFQIITDAQWRAEHPELPRHSTSTLHIQYASMVNPKLKDYISIEFIPRHYSSDKIKFNSVVPYSIKESEVSTKIPNIKFEQTFWDKIYALYSINKNGVSRDSLSRHFYDVIHIVPYVTLEETQNMFWDTVEYQKLYTTKNLQMPNKTSGLDIVPDTEKSQVLEQDYSANKDQYITPIVPWEYIMLGTNQLQQKIRGL